jgi:hypothetical protein
MIKNYAQFITEEDHEKATTKRLFCDLDGVLVDFDRGFTEIPENTEHLLPKDYEEKHGKNSIWPLIEKYGESFWTDLKWMKDGRELWDYIKRYDPIILSSPSLSDTCIPGKTKWVRQNLTIKQEPVTDSANFTDETRLILDRDKYKYAKSENDILIDDTREKLEKWSEAGGTGILHDDATDTIRVVEQIMTGESED